MYLIVAIIIALLILGGKGIGYFIGGAWDLLWFLVFVALIVWFMDRSNSRPGV